MTLGLERLRKHFRRGCDEGATSIISYVVAASVFILASSFLVNFLMHPPSSTTSDLDFSDLKSRSNSAMDVIMGTTGFPEYWADTDGGADQVKRLGLIEEGSTIRINASKFDRLARGSFVTQSSQNGVIDYAEAKSALGLTGYDFHLRAYPVFDLNETGWGVVDMLDYDIAYVGDIPAAGSWSQAAYKETTVLDALNVSFTNGTRNSLASGDVFRDDKAMLKTYLVPLIGNRVDQTVISAGAGTKYDFLRVNASAYSAYVPLQLAPAPSKAIALSSTGSDLGYTKNREIRAIVGAANLSGLGEVNLTWNEWVDTDLDAGSRDAGDFGWVEVSANNGQSWCTLATSVDSAGSPQTPATAFRGRSVAINNATCSGAAYNGNVLIGFHWQADNDNSIGRGWIVDDVTVWNGVAVENVGTVLLQKTYETPEYDMLIIGSDVDQNELTSDEIKDAIRDFVMIYGGRIMVLGGQANTNWLQPLFHVGTRGASQGVGTPDVTHPMLTTPNDLDHNAYTSTQVGEWDFTASGDEDLFTMVVGTSTGHVLSASTRGAFGSNDLEGAVILTTYRPYMMTGTDAYPFFANSIMYGKYHHLYLEVGPEVPTGIAVASATRSAVMDVTVSDADDRYSEMAFILYLWPGLSTSSTVAAATLEPTPARNVTANTSGGAIWVNWSWPESNGTSNVTGYEVWRGNSPSTITTLVTSVSNTTFSYVDPHSNLDNGTTYYYNVTARNAAGRSAPSGAASATPVDFPGAPTIGSPTGGFGEISVPWTAPASTGGGAITGYRVWYSSTSGNYGASDYADLGVTTSYLQTGLGEQVTRYYKVQALNGAGWGANSSEATGTTSAVPGAPQTLVVSNATAGPGNLTLTWAAPLSQGTGSLTGYKIWVSSNGGVDYTLLTQTSNPLNVSFQHNGLGLNATRHYKVQAVSTVGDGANSSAQNAKTFGAPNTPIAFTATGNIILHTAALSWVAPWSEASIVKYEIHRGATAETTAYIASVYSPLLVYNDSPGSGTWHYKVYAVSAAGTSNAASASTTA